MVMYFLSFIPYTEQNLSLVIVMACASCFFFTNMQDSSSSAFQSLTQHRTHQNLLISTAKSWEYVAFFQGLNARSDSYCLFCLYTHHICYPLVHQHSSCHQVRKWDRLVRDQIQSLVWLSGVYVVLSRYNVLLQVKWHLKGQLVRASQYLPAPRKKPSMLKLIGILW